MPINLTLTVTKNEEHPGYYRLDAEGSGDSEFFGRISHSKLGPEYPGQPEAIHLLADSMAFSLSQSYDLRAWLAKEILHALRTVGKTERT